MSPAATEEWGHPWGDVPRARRTLRGSRFLHLPALAPGSSAVGVPRRCPTCAGLSQCPSLAERPGTQNCYFTRSMCWRAFPRLNSNDRERVCGRQGLSPGALAQQHLPKPVPRSQHPANIPSLQVNPPCSALQFSADPVKVQAKKTINVYIN